MMVTGYAIGLTMGFFIGGFCTLALLVALGWGQD